LYAFSPERNEVALGGIRFTTESKNSTSADVRFCNSDFEAADPRETSDIVVWAVNGCGVATRAFAGEDVLGGLKPSI